MAARRMFSLRLMNSTRFLKMPATSQLLYVHLGMRADDDGVVEAYPVMKIVGCNEDDLRVLVAKGFAKILNEDLVTYLTDWNENNHIRPDRKVDSIYKDLLLQMIPDVDNCQTPVRQLTDTCQADDGQMVVSCQQNDRIGKDRLGKDRLGKDRTEENIYSSSVRDEPTDYEEILSTWNQLESVGIKPIRFITGKRKDAVRARIRQYGKDAIIEAIWRIRESDFLVGKNNRGWVITFDWFIKPSNFPKVLEGNYENGQHQAKSKLQQQLDDMENWGKNIGQSNIFG